MFFSSYEGFQSRDIPLPRHALGIDIPVSECLILYMTALLEPASCDVRTGQVTQFRVRSHAESCALHMNLEFFFDNQPYNRLLLEENGFDALTCTIIKPFYKKCMELVGPGSDSVHHSVLHGYRLKPWFTGSIEQTAQTLCRLANDFLENQIAEQIVVSIV